MSFPNGGNQRLHSAIHYYITLWDGHFHTIDSFSHSLSLSFKCVWEVCEYALSYVNNSIMAMCHIDYSHVYLLFITIILMCSREEEEQQQQQKSLDAAHIQN